MVAATKWDAIATRDPEEQRVVACSLRTLAHAAGAHLLYLGGLQPGGGAGGEGALACRMLQAVLWHAARSAHLCAGPVQRMVWRACM